MNYEDIFSPQTLSKLNKKSAENLKQMIGDKNLMQTMISSQKLLGEISKAEAPYKEQLEELAVQMVEDLYPIINEEGIKIDAKIVGIGDVNSSLDESISPESRRRIINGITQGAALRGAFSFYLFKEYLDTMDDTLVDKYNQIMKNSFGIYDDDNAIAMLLSLLAQGHKAAGGSSKVIMNEIKVNNPTKIDQSKEFEKIISKLEDKYPNYNDTKIFNLANNEFKKKFGYGVGEKLNESQESGITIRARAICFPMLVHEIIKGLYELVSLQGFKGDKEANQGVVDKVDKLEHEPHDLKYGKYIYDALNDIFAESQYSDPRIREFFFQEVYQLEDEEFLTLIENAINEELTPSQKRWVDQTLKEISMDLKADDASQYID